MSTHNCTICNTVTQTHCPITGLAFCTSAHMQQHWDANPWIYTLQGKRDKRSKDGDNGDGIKKKKKKTKSKKDKRKENKRERRGDKASIVARSIANMPAHTMSEREAIHLNELKTRFDNARDSHRKQLKNEAKTVPETAEGRQARANSVEMRRRDLREKRRVVDEEYDRLSRNLERRITEAQLSMEYVLLEQVKFADRTSDDQLDVSNVTQNRQLKNGNSKNNSDERQLAIEIEGEEEEDDDAENTTAASTTTRTMNDGNRMDNHTVSDSAVDVMRAESAEEDDDEEEPESESDAGEYDAFILWPDGQYTFTHNDTGYMGDMVALPVIGGRLAGHPYTLADRIHDSDHSRWASFVASEYNFSLPTGLQGTVYIYPPPPLYHFLKEERRQIRDALKKHAKNEFGEDTRTAKDHDVVVLHMDGTYELSHMSDEDLSDNFATNEIVKSGQILSFGSGHQKHSSYGVNPWGSFLYDKVRWDGAVYNAPIAFVARDQYARPVDVTENDAFLKAIEKKSLELTKKHGARM
jgi:hypothetical protein